MTTQEEMASSCNKRGLGQILGKKIFTEIFALPTQAAQGSGGVPHPWRDLNYVDVALEDMD